MQPEAALIAYTYKDEYRHVEYYLESRKIGENGLMGAGKPVSGKFIQALVKGFAVEASSTPHGNIPKQVLYSDTRKNQEKYVWYSPPCRKFMYFKDNLNIENGEYCIPGLIWTVRNDSLYLYSYMSKRVSPGMQLFSAPFFNVSPKDGDVCLGNAKLKLPENPSFQSFIKYWEDLFFLSEFSHLRGDNPTKTNLVLAVKRSAEVFNYDELIPVRNLKLNKLLK